MSYHSFPGAPVNPDSIAIPAGKAERFTREMRVGPASPNSLCHNRIKAHEEAPHLRLGDCPAGFVGAAGCVPSHAAGPLWTFRLATDRNLLGGLPPDLHPDCHAGIQALPRVR